MRPALPALLFALALFAALFAAACQPRHDNPPLHYRVSDVMCQDEAFLHARDLHLGTHAPGEAGISYYVLDTHSMEPVLWGGDYIVVDRTRRLKDIPVGRIVTYRPQWGKPGDPVNTHRIVEKDAHGAIVSGDNVRPLIADNGQDLRSENRYRVLDENLVGEVIAIYRVEGRH